MSTSTVISKDGTVIAYDKVGSGPAVVLVDGAFCYRDMGPCAAVAQELSDRYTVYTYDRRGRGESGNTLPYDRQHEIEDLAAVAAEAGEPVSLCTFSSGVGLVLAAVENGLAVDKLALYEYPLITDDSRKPVPHGYQDHIAELIAADKPSAAIKYFLHAGIGLSSVLVALFPLLPGWSKMRKTAFTLTYDRHFMEDALDGRPIPTGRYDYITAPTTVFAGSKSPQWMRHGNVALAQAIPGAVYVELPGQTHQVKAKFFTPTLKKFLEA
ncbi:MAG: alpha/beta hydrolase [Nocardia sp.]|uniref:alpha/beta fold hydrolase n=1 Tax=Nocardia sp. TaxID=1821 RepID=UPI00262EA515|nr:alpha/beta fold hydrolase [Nocardia sp.]MCU1643917.1 alpha/beta hydrolase [Nocardia sp.]